MKIISALTEADFIDAYTIEKLSHPIPWSEQTFRSNQGEHYLNRKIAVNHQLAGFAICQTVLDEATLFNIAIAPQFRQQGLAKQLLNHLLEELENKNIKILWLEVRESNTAAINLYQNLGFNELTIRKNYYPTKDGREDALIMAYNISF